LVGDEVAKKLGKNLSSPLTEAGLLMEDAEPPRKARKNLCAASKRDAERMPSAMRSDLTGTSQTGMAADAG